MIAQKWKFPSELTSTHSEFGWPETRQGAACRALKLDQKFRMLPTLRLEVSKSLPSRNSSFS